MQSFSNLADTPKNEKSNPGDPTKYSMFDNLEFFYYAQKFSGETFIFSAESLQNFEGLIYDFYLLKQTKIQFVLIIPEDRESHIREIEISNFMGVNFRIIKNASEAYTPAESSNDIPLYLFNTASGLSFKEAVYQVARELRTKKIFFLSNFPEKRLCHNGRSVFEMNLDELNTAIQNGGVFNIETETLRFFRKILTESEIECVLLNQEQGGIYKELFTHLGYGTIFSKNYQKIIRPGTSKDILPILLLTKIYEQEGFLLPMAKEDLTQNMKNSFVYLVENTIVAFAMLIDYGKTAELAKFCTQPRYQAKGKAKDLALKLIETAKERNYESVFALSVVEGMWRFFTKLGFREIPREDLPEEWQKKYDLSRPSKAFLLEFN